MILAPYCCGHGACVTVQGYRGYGVPAGYFDWSHVEPKNITVAMSTADMKGRIALQARSTSALCQLAQLAYCVVTKCRCSYALHQVKASCITKLDLWVPERTIHVDPVVVRCPLEWFTGEEWPALFLLPKAVLFLGFVDEVFLHPLFFPVSIGFLLV
jgi:hypothetical protein